MTQGPAFEPPWQVVLTPGPRCLSPGQKPLGFLAILGRVTAAQIPASICSPPRGEGCSLPAPAGPPCLTSGCVFLAAAFRPRLPVRRCKRGACGGGDGGGASAFPTWTSLPSQPFSKARASFLDMPVEAWSVWASAGGLGEAAARCLSGELAPGPAHGHRSSAPSPPLEGRASLAIWPAWGPGPGRPGAAAQRLLGRPKGSQVSYSVASTWGLCWVPAGGSSAEGSSPDPCRGLQGSCSWSHGELLLVALGAAGPGSGLVFPSLAELSV